MSASTTVLPPPACTARRKAGQRRLWLLFCCEASQLLAVVLQGLYRPDRLRPCYKACASRIVRRLCSPAAALFCRLCLPVHPLPCHAHCPHRLPRSVQFCFAPCSVHVRQDHRELYNMFASCKTVPLAATTRVCSGGPAPCCVHHTVTGAASLPVGSRTMGTASEQPMRRCPLPRKRGGLGLHLGSRPSSPHLHFLEPETACEQPGSLLTLFLFAEFMILGHGSSVNA